MFRIGPVVINKDGGGVALLHKKDLKLAATLLYEGEPYEGPNMDERVRSIFLGGLINIYQLTFQYYKDIQNKSNGSVITITYAPKFNFGKFMISPRPFYQHWNDHYVNYYFGVKPSGIDLSRNRATYDGSAATNYGLNIRTVYTDGPWQYFINIGQKYYGDTIASSPTTHKKQSVRLVLGFIYSFF